MIRVLIGLILLFPTPAAGASVLDFGAVPNDGHDDTAAFRAAAQRGGTIQVPAGTYDLAVSGVTAVTYPRSIQFVGEGADLSILQTERKLTATGTLVFFRPGTRAMLQDLGIAGPAECGDSTCNLLYHNGGLGGSLRVDRCILRGGTQAIKMGEAAWRQDKPRLVVTDCLVESPRSVLALNSGSVDLVRSEFRAYGIAGTNKGHAVYVYCPVSLLVDRCLFGGNVGGGYDIHPYSWVMAGRGTVTIRDSGFVGSASGKGILTHPQTRTLVRGCVLGKTPIMVQRGGALIVDSSLTDKAQVTAYPWSAGEWTFRDCRFGGD